MTHEAARSFQTSSIPMKIYTRTGDDGLTGLFGGPRVSKDDLRIEAYGTADELNSVLGVARAALNTRKPGPFDEPERTSEAAARRRQTTGQPSLTPGLNASRMNCLILGRILQHPWMPRPPFTVWGKIGSMPWRPTSIASTRTFQL